MSLGPRRFLRRLLALFRWSSRDLDMDREMAFHVDSLKRHHMDSGLSEAEADRAARRQFGSLVRLKERGHDIRSAPAIEAVVRDAKFAVRGLRRTPGFAVAVTLTLALGIGGNTAIFSVVDQLLLRPLPYPDGERLVMAYDASISRYSVSPGNWLDWQRESRTMESFAAWRPLTVTLMGDGEPERLEGQLVSAEFFPLLGVAPLLGRVVSAEDDRPDAPGVAVLSYGLWQRRFGGDAAIVGRTVRLDAIATDVIGVMPPGFRFVEQGTDYWSAFRLPRDIEWRQRAGRFINVVGRVKAGVAVADAQREMTAIARVLADTHEFNRNTTTTLVPLREELTGRVRQSLVVLYAAVGVLLSIACFNVANLLLARAASRRGEIAIRASLGAGRLAIVRQLLVETLLMAVAGGAMGVILARWSLDTLVAFAPPDLLRVPDLYVDRRVLFYAAGLSVLTGLVVGLVPAVSVARRSLTAHIRATSDAVLHSPRARQILVVGQMALTVVLLCGAGLLIRTFMALNSATTGFDRQHVLSLDVTLPPTRYDDERRTAFFTEASAAIAALPGVEAVGAGNSLPVIGSPRGGTGFHRLGTPVPPRSETPSTRVRVVTPGYFRTLRIPVLRGREFTESDQTSTAAPGFVVNDAFARTLLSGIDPLTAALSVNMQRPDNPYRPVIGVVGDLNEGSVRNPAQPTVFYSHRQMPETGMTLFIRTAQPGAVGARAVDTLHALDRDLAVTNVRTLDVAFAESLARERLNALVSGAFALSGLLLASLGLYALLAFLVAERTKEFGIRIALGVQMGRLMRSVIGSGLRLVGIGVAVGVTGSLVLTRSLGTLLFGVTPYDLRTYAAVLGLLCAVAAWASWVPARRAVRVEPLVALRQD